MIKKIILLFMVILSCTTIVYSFGMNCEFKNSCSTGETPLFYAHKDFKDGSSNVLSSNVQITLDSNYNRVLCCNTDSGNLNAHIVEDSVSCPTSATGSVIADIMYFTNNTNARLAVKEHNLTTITNPLFDINHYSHKLCLVNDNNYSTMHVVISNQDLSLFGYNCMYRISGITNAHVSDCDATFNGPNKYEYALWGNVWQVSNTLKCNQDCTSKIDGRVYSDCGSKIDECRFVPKICDGALLGSWVKNEVGTKEVQCSPSWMNIRNLMFTKVPLNVTTVDGECDNLISKDYPVLVNNEMVIMKIYLCGD